MSMEKVPEGSPAGKRCWNGLLASTSETSSATGSKKAKKKGKKTVSLGDFLTNKSSSPVTQKANWADATEDIDPSGEAVGCEGS